MNIMVDSFYITTFYIEILAADIKIYTTNQYILYK